MMSKPFRIAVWAGFSMILLGLVSSEVFRRIAFPCLFLVSPLLIIFLSKRGLSQQIQICLTFLYWILLIGLPLASSMQWRDANLQVAYAVYFYGFYILPFFIFFLSFPVFFLFFLQNQHWFKQAFLFLLILLHAVAFLLLNAAYVGERGIEGLVIAQAAALLFGDFIRPCLQSKTCNLFAAGVLVWFTAAGLHLVYILVCLIWPQAPWPKQYRTTPPRQRGR